MTTTSVQDGDGLLDASEMTAALAEFHTVWVKNTLSYNARWRTRAGLGEAIAEKLLFEDSWGTLMERKLEFGGDSGMWTAIRKVLTKTGAPPGERLKGTWGHCFQALTTWMLDDLLGEQNPSSRQASQSKLPEVLFMPN